MKRYVAALLVVVGVVGLVGVLAVGTGFAEDENDAGAKCSKATLHGTYLFANDGVDVTGKNRSHSPLQAMMSMTATVRSTPSLQLTLTGM
jgi:hypothetical protein